MSISDTQKDGPYDKPRRVLIIVENLSVPADRRVWTEACTLMAAGYKVSTISPNGRDRDRRLYERLNGIAVYRYPAPPLTSGVMSFLFEFAYCWLATLLLSLIVLAREGFDIIQACNPPETFWPIALLYKSLGKRFIFDHHDPSPEMYLARFGNRGFLYKVLLWLERMTYRAADAWITVNEQLAEIVAKRNGVPATDVAVVRSGPDPDEWEAGRIDESLRRGKRWMICYLGVMNPQDGVDYLLRSADYLVHRLGYDVLFALLGSGDALDGLKAMAHELRLEDHVYFAGWADMDTIRRYLSTADVCVDPIPRTPYSEYGAFNKILEYMSMARPIVAFDLIGTRWMAREAALYATPNHVEELAILSAELLDDEALRKQMGEFGRKRIVSELSWTHQKEIYLEVYRKVVTGVARPARRTT